jgi:stage II sporulation protein D
LLKYNGKPASVFYFSSTGGEKTEDVSNVWGASIPYLVSVESNYETDKSWNAKWTSSFSGDKIRNILAERKVDIGNILDIVVSKRSEAGRVIELKVKGQKGEKIFTKESVRSVFGLSSQFYQVISNENFVVRDLKGLDTRAINGSKIISAAGIKELSTQEKEITIKSSTKSIQKKIEPQNYTFTGKGWGHAVGLSQDGAIGMANAGFTYDKILTHYFKGTLVE